LRHSEFPVLLVEEDKRSLRPLVFDNRAHSSFIGIEKTHSMTGGKREEQPAAHANVRATQHAREQQISKPDRGAVAQVKVRERNVRPGWQQEIAQLDLAAVGIRRNNLEQGAARISVTISKNCQFPIGRRTEFFLN